MVLGLSVNRLVNVELNLAPLAAQTRNFGALLIMGDSDVINSRERQRVYNDLNSVADDFGTVAPEYLAATVFFEQAPQPQTLYIGRWLRTASKGLLVCGALNATEQLISNFNTITNGGFHITVDGGSSTNITGLNFTSDTNLNAVAATIQAGLTGATCIWNGESFVIESASTGTSSNISYLTAPSSGTDISALIGGTSASGAQAPIAGLAAETALAAVTELADMSADWYCVEFASSVLPVTSDYLAVANFIEGASPSRIFGITTQDANTLVSSATSDISYQLLGEELIRTFVQYSSYSPYAAVSFFARAASIDFSANNSTLTLMYKQEPGITPEILTGSQINTLNAKRCNVYAQYQNNTAIVEEGYMSGPAWFDDIQDLDWLTNELQTQVYNLLYQSATKIPQTDAGMNQIINVIDSVMAEAVNNGTVAPGQWNAGGFGQLQQGQYLKTGYYVYAPPMASQSQGQREARIAPPIQIAAKLAGAIQYINITLNANR